MKQLANERKNTSKIYYLNENNIQKISKLDNVAYSIDRKYALVYTQEDHDFMDKFWDLYEKDEYYQESSTEDMFYDLFLDEAGIEPYEPGRSKLKNHEIDFSKEELVHIDKFIIPLCLIDKKINLEEGSDIIIAIASNNTHALVVSIKENSNDI